MSAFTSAAHDEDSDTIARLQAENEQLRQALLTMHGTLEKTARVGAAYVQANETLRDSMIRWAARAEEAEELLEAIGAGGVGSPIRPQAEQPTVKESLTAQAEPVAWLYQAADPDGWNQHLEWTPTKAGYHGEWERIPLYTYPPELWHLIDENQRLRAELKFNTQPAQQPLTDEQIKMIDRNTNFHESPDWPVRFARAIERAHGIGGEA